MNWSLHPTLYQFCHPWHWLTYSQNALAFGISVALVALIVDAVTVVVLIRTLRAVNRQAKAADRQAEAAEAQVLAARSATAVSDAQRIAAEQSAAAARMQSELIRYEFLAKLRPILAIDKDLNPRNVSAWQFWLVNHGGGAALDIEPKYRGRGVQPISLSANLLGPGSKTLFYLNIERAQSDGFQICYGSEDGRRFATTVTVEGHNFTAKTFQINESGGWVPEPEIPEITSDPR
jgi:hypothetical protein